MTTCLCLLLLALPTVARGESLTDQLNRNGFPLTVGNRWEYVADAAHTVELVDTQKLVAEIRWRVEVRWEIAAREGVFGEDAYRFDVTHRTASGPDSGLVATGQTWFTMRGDTLWGLASRDIGGLNPAVAQLFKPLADAAPPTLWGVASLAFPLEVGASWPFSGPGGGDDKTVEAVETVVLPFGGVEAFRVVRHFLPPVVGFSLRSQQWFNALGMVRLRHESIAMAPLTDEQGMELGSGRSTDTVHMDLVRYTLTGHTPVAFDSWGAVKSIARQ